MLYLAFIYHMHQPYYKNLLTGESPLPWVRLHGIKDYLDMVEILSNYPKIKQVFNMVPSLLEQIEDYTKGQVKDKFLELSYKETSALTPQDKQFLLDNFFMINKERVISLFPRYYELYFKKEAKKEFNTQDYLDLQVYFNLSWFDPSFRDNIPELKKITAKARFFTEEDKRAALDSQIKILSRIIPTYKEFAEKGQIEVTLSPYYHPILPLLFNTQIAREANKKSVLPQPAFSYPQDAKAQIDTAVSFYQEKFATRPQGMWPSEEGVSEHILPFIMESGINWIVTDEAILFKSLKKKKRDTETLYQPHLLKREEGTLSIVFCDRNLSDLIGFAYQGCKTEDAVNNFMHHLKNIASAFKDQDILVTVAMDGENAWEYYTHDGHDFLELLYQRLSEADFLKTTTVSEYLRSHPAKSEIKRLAAGSWIYGEFSKWINNPVKNKAWEYLGLARKEWTQALNSKTPALDEKTLKLAWKQIYVAEGSDWFWWYGDNEMNFDSLFRMHLSNFYTLINKDVPGYLQKPLQ